MKKRQILASFLLLLIPAIASTQGGRRNPSVPNTTSSVTRSDTPSRGSLSAVDSLKALEKLAADISALITLPEAKKGNVGIEVRSLATSKTLFSMSADKPLTPASTTKVVTTFTALCELGANYMVRTVVATDGRPAAGVVRGNLYVKGYGDPFFSVNEIDHLVDQVLAAGIKQVDGNIVGDGTFFDEKTERTEYSGDEDVVVALPPIAALTIEQSVFTVVISSPRTPGVPCNVQTYPPSSGFQIVNSAVTSTPAPAGRKRRGKRRSDLLVPGATESDLRYGDESPLAYEAYNEGIIDQDIIDQEMPNQRKPKKTPAAAKSSPKKKTQAKAAPKQKVTAKQKNAPARTAKGTAARKVTPKAAPAKTKAAASPEPAPKGAGPIRVAISTGENGRQVITVTGSLPPGKTVSYRYKMKNPPQVIAGMLFDRLRSHGVTIAGGAVSGVTPVRNKVIAETGRPLQEILQLVMKNSNNFLAEYVFKMIGGAAGGQQETAQKTVEKIQHRMSINSVPFGRCIINDGSGLSRANCLSASALTGILTAAYHDRSVFPPFYESMSIAGVDGTLRKRMKGTFAEGNVHGKTGTLRNVSALAGYVTTRDGEQLCFSMLMNGGNHGAYRGLQDKIAARLASFTYGEVLASEAKAKEKEGQ